MKVTITAQVTYSYEVEVPEEEKDLLAYCDTADPAYCDICKVLSNNHLNFDGEILSICEDETGEVLYTSY